jgi:hypothetical protein
MPMTVVCVFACFHQSCVTESKWEFMCMLMWLCCRVYVFVWTCLPWFCLCIFVTHQYLQLLRF